MTRLVSLLLVLFGSSSLYAQVAAQQMGTPAGTFFTESFGDNGSEPCGYGAPWNQGLYQYTGCNVIWGNTVIGTGGAISIAPSPGATTYPRGKYSLKMVTGTAPTYLSTVGFTPTVSASTAFDLQFTLNVASTSLSAYNAQPIYSFVSTPSSGNFPCRVDLHSTSAGTVAVHGEGTASSSDTVNLTLNADHIVFMHCVPGGGAGTSYIQLDGGTKQTFKASATAWTTQMIGAWNGNQQSMTYSIGNVLINSTIQGTGNGPKLYTNFSHGTSGSGLTAALLTSSTVGGNGAWGPCPSSTSYQTFSTAAQLNLVLPVDVLGVQYTGASSTLGDAFNLAGAVSGYCPYAWISFAPTASTFEWVETTLSTSDASTYASMNIIANDEGSDFTSHMFNAGQLYLETDGNPNGAPDVGSFYGYATSTRYGFATQYQQYDASSAPGAVYLVEGAVTTGTFAANEQLTQGTSGATATLIGSANGLQALEIQMDSGTANATNTWVGETSGAVFTPTSLPTTFHTLIIYDANCNVLSRQMKIANSDTPAPPAYYYLGRGGDNNAKGVSGYFYTGDVFLDYASGNMIPCH